MYLAWIHPYGNGNGRTARLVEFHILVSSGVPTPAAHLLSNHYNKTRPEYYRQLDLASKKNWDLVPFILYALQGYVDGLREQISHVTEHQLDLSWRDDIDTAFRYERSTTGIRRKQLVNDLCTAKRVVPKHDIRHLSPTLAELYANLTDKALTRDLNSPVVQKFVENTNNGYYVNRDAVLGWLPLRAAPNRLDS